MLGFKTFAPISHPPKAALVIWHVCLLSFPCWIPQLWEVGHTRAKLLRGHILFCVISLICRFAVSYLVGQDEQVKKCVSVWLASYCLLVYWIVKLLVCDYWLVALTKNIYCKSVMKERRLERIAFGCSVNGSILCELRLSVAAWIRTCKAGLVQVLIGLVKHIRCSDFEMSLTPIIPWHYSQAYGPPWATCLSTPHWRKKTTSVSEHVITSIKCIVKGRQIDIKVYIEYRTFIHLSSVSWELFGHYTV